MSIFKRRPKLTAKLVHIDVNGFTIVCGETTSTFTKNEGGPPISPGTVELMMRDAIAIERMRIEGVTE